MSRYTAVIVAALTAAGSAVACSICAGFADQVPLRLDARRAKVVAHGRMMNPRLHAAGADGFSRGGVTDFHVERVVKSADGVTVPGVIAVPRYVPVADKEPTRFIVLCDIADGRFDPYRGVPAKSPALVEFLAAGLPIGETDAAGVIRWAFAYLDHPDEAVASEAFLEFARTGDADIHAAAKRLDPAKLRKLLADPKTPPERLGLYALLLGACGSPSDAELFLSMIRSPNERTRPAQSGLLAGLIALRPDEGWAQTRAILGDAKRSVPERFAAMTVLRYIHGAKPEPIDPNVLAGLAVLLPQGDIADMAIEDLRRWKVWTLTDAVLAQYGRKSHDAPLVKRSVVRYALSCPEPAAKAFVERLRRDAAELVKDVEESLQYER